MTCKSGTRHEQSLITQVKRTIQLENASKYTAHPYPEQPYGGPP